MSEALANIVGSSPAICRMRDLIRSVAPTRLPVLIEGPTGSGKELVAAALHHASGRRGAYVAFNVCAIADTMFEDALFGHVRGAFTGATDESPGFLREGNAGTVFFDEISGLQPVLQAKILRAIETGEFRPVGAKRDVRSEFRVVAATNEPHDLLVQSGRLRADLAHRLGAVVVHVPPLSERMEDLPLLVERFLQRMDAGSAVDVGAFARMRDHAWPGNVRELRNVVECAVALGGMSAYNVSLAMSQRTSENRSASMSRRQQLRETLEAHEWNAHAVAKILGVHRATVYRWIKETRLDIPA